MPTTFGVRVGRQIRNLDDDMIAKMPNGPIVAVDRSHVQSDLVAQCVQERREPAIEVIAVATAAIVDKTLNRGVSLPLMLHSVKRFVLYILLVPLF